MCTMTVSRKYPVNVPGLELSLGPLRHCRVGICLLNEIVKAMQDIIS